MVILTFGVIDWYYLRQRPQQLATALASHATVVYAHPRTAVAAWRARARLPRGALSAWHAPGPAAGRPLWLYEPLLLPRHRGAWLRAINRRLFLAGLKRELRRRRLSPDWIWIGHPLQCELLDAWPDRPVVYDCMDEWAEFPGARKMAALEARVLDRASRVIASSRPLAERLSRRHASVHLVLNGVDHDHFRAALALRRPADPAAAKRAITVGTFGSWVDFGLIAAVARARPDWHFQLIGPVEVAPPEGLPRGPNIEWLGRRPYEELPERLARAEIAFLPFRQDRLTAGVDPIKAYEFLAAGLPIVATPLPELAKFESGVYGAATPEHFARSLDEALAGVAGLADRERLSASVAPHAWAARAATVFHLLAEGRGPAARPGGSSRAGPPGR